ncbi:Cys-tRNA(Pro)/Cys-tRNA(Cys) deacylase YbaK [Oligella sp. MSHR50489EDL]|uniref:aminoacyl-tRNA deacylase n=1 Tax=Oligella sp. MSHR50489EDL TaxID=3139409 RepID=UPI003D8137EA
MKKSKKDTIKTPATLFLDRQKIPYEVFECKGEIEGTAEFMAKFLGVPTHQVIKSIVLNDEKNKGYMVLQHGDQTIDTKTLRKIFGVKSVTPASYELAHKWTGYEFGGTSPFGIKANIPIYAESSIFEMETLFINGGRRGVNLKITPDALLQIGVKPIETTK